jgi:hypothetical protein
MEMVQKLKVAYSKKIAQKVVKVYCPCKAQGKKTFLSTSNVIISQSVWSTVLKVLYMFS